LFDRTGRRAEIIRAAFAQLATVGFEGLRMRQIAAEVGVDQSTLHHHFPTKQDIVAAVTEYAISQFAGTPPARTLREYLDHLRTMAVTRPEVFVVTVELQLRARRDPEVRAVIARNEAVYRAWLSELLGTPGAVDLVIAVVNGVQLNPGITDAAFDHLTTLLDE
jgi:TetR/AcrR family transcriptional repressor of nem operon